MRSLKMLLCSAAVVAMFGAPGTNAQEWTKTTYFTFTSPVQLPGITLPAGEYMFKLADPETGRRVIGVWEKDGSKFYGMMQTRIEERMRDAQDSSDLKDSVVMFREAPAGEAQAVRSYAYVGERMGYEFIYPREQASKIAKANQTSVLATDSGGFGQVDQSGTFASSADATATTARTATATTTTATATTTTAAAEPAPVASTTPAASTAPAPASASTAPAPASAVTSTATATATTAAAPEPEPAPAPAAATAVPSTTVADPEPVGLTARAQDEPRPVGTAGQNALPQTSSALPAMQLIGGFSLLAGFAVRRFRMRLGTNV